MGRFYLKGGYFLKKITWMLWLIAGICFLIVGIMKFGDKNSYSGVMFIALGGLYLVLAIVNYRTKDKSNQIEIPKAVLANMDEELRNLIAENKKIKAIKKCRIVTNMCGKPTPLGVGWIALAP